MATSSCCSCDILRWRAVFSFCGDAAGCWCWALRASRSSFSFLGFQFERYRVERPFAAVEQLLLRRRPASRAPRCRCSLRSRIDATSRRLVMLAGHVGEVARREDIGQIIVVPVVAIGFAHHFGVLGTVAVQRSAEVSGDAVRAVDLPAQQAGLLLGLFEQLVPRIYLACQTPYALLGGGAALLELRNLPLLGGDFLLQCRDNPLLLVRCLRSA